MLFRMVMCQKYQIWENEDASNKHVEELSETDEKLDEDDEDDLPLNQFTGQMNGGGTKGLVEKAVNHTYRW